MLSKGVCEVEVDIWYVLCMYVPKNIYMVCYIFVVFCRVFVPVDISISPIFVRILLALGQ